VIGGPSGLPGRRARWPDRRGVIAAAAGAAAGAARLSYSALNRYPPGGTKTWSRTNHRGEPVTMLEGPAVAVGAIVGMLAQAGLEPETGSAGWRPGLAMAVGGAGAAAFGAYDDLAGSGDRRGFRGHLGALRHGEMTTGAVKLGGIGVSGLLSAALAGGSPADVVINAALIAGSANLLNLFDLRPGRAIKVAAVSGGLIVLGGSLGGSAGASSRRAALAPLPPLAAALALLPEDLGERAMLGDCGANGLGAILGAAAAGLPRSVRIALLAGIAGLTAASEKVSFTRVIERTPALRWLDMLGRRPADPVPAVTIPVQPQQAMSLMQGGRGSPGGKVSPQGGSGEMGSPQGGSRGTGSPLGRSGEMGSPQGRSTGTGSPRGGPGGNRGTGSPPKGASGGIGPPTSGGGLGGVVPPEKTQ